MKSRKSLRWMVLSIHHQSKRERLIGIYGTKEEAEFILGKAREGERKTGYVYKIDQTDKPLHPSSSQKVGKHLSTLSTNQLSKE